MVSRRGKDEPSHIEIGEVSYAASDLTAYGCYISSQHLQDDWARMQFNRELAYYARRIVNDVEERRLSPEEGLAQIRTEKHSLMNQARQVAGLVGGAGQLITGAGICYGTAGVACAFLGGPLIAHGANNVYESGRNLTGSRNDTEGPLKKIYQSGAKILGLSAGDGNAAYLASDIALSGASLLRPVLKKDAWRLFRYLSSDKETAVKQMSKRAIAVELILNAHTGSQLNDELQDRRD